jgi:hypothetical protein
MRYDVGPYDPCPCGSGAKYKFCCAAKAKANRHGKFPIGTVAYYGPDDKTTTKVVASVILREEAEPILERMVGTNVSSDPQTAERVKRFFAQYGVKNTVVATGNIGCPHEEGEDFPLGEDCPFCPFWAGKQGTARRQSPPNKGDLLSLDAGLAVDEDETDEDEDTDFDEEGDAEEEDAAVSRSDADATFERVETILGDGDRSFDEALDVLLKHLSANLTLPCEVTGTEDFQWEEPYVIGGWSQAEYKLLKKTQPSYRDRYELIGLSRGAPSDWMMCEGEDICAHVRRISDGKKFVLGLSELKATEKQGRNQQLIRDFGIWFWNSR